jgi:hypothetical protein
MRSAVHVCAVRLRASPIRIAAGERIEGDPRVDAGEAACLRGFTVPSSRTDRESEIGSTVADRPPHAGTDLLCVSGCMQRTRNSAKPSATVMHMPLSTPECVLRRGTRSTWCPSLALLTSERTGARFN